MLRIDRGQLLSMTGIVALFVINAGIALRNTQEVQESEAWVAHTHEVLAELAAILSALTDAETGQRGYLLTSAEPYLQPYQDALTKLAGHLRHVEKLTADNPEQTARVNDLEPLIAKKLSELQRTIDLFRNAPDQEHGFAAARQLVRTDQGKLTMDGIRAVVAQMVQTEQRLLHDRDEAAKKTYRTAVFTTLVALTLGLGLVAGSFSLVQRNLALRQRAAEAIHSERERLHTTLISIGDAVIVTDRASRVTLMNPVAQDLIGWKGDPIGQPLDKVFCILNEQSRQPVESPVSRVLREGTVAGLANHTVLIAKDGMEVPIDDSGAPIRDAHGDIIGVVLVFRDIRERRRTESALQQQQARLRLLLEHTPAPVAMFDREMKYLYYSPRWLVDYGLGDQDLTGKSHYEVFPNMPQRWRETHQRCLAGAVEKNDEDHFIRPDGKEEWLRWEVRPWTDERGTIGGIIIFSEIITERKRGDEVLRQSERRFHQLADLMSQLAWMARPDGYIYWYNRRWFEYTGTTPTEMEGWGWQSVHDPHELPQVLQCWKASIASGQPFDMVFPLRGADGRYRPFLTRGMPLRGEDGRILHWFGTNTDISDIMEKEEALREADRRKDEFLAMLAHELRNPLAPIRNAVEVLRLSGPTEPPLQQAREMIERQVNHLVRLVDDLLDVSRITRGRITLQKGPVDLATVIVGATESCRPLIDARGHDLRVSLSSTPVRVEGDPTRLTQVVLNLLSNAAKYTPEGGRIDLTVCLEPGEAVIRVRDNGVGIAPELLPKVFDMFTQAERTLDRSQGGLGIGLTLVQRLVELHGGSVQASSDGLGRGSEFVVRLPILPLAMPPAGGLRKEGEPSGERSGLPGRRILVVDDNSDAAASLAMLLRFLGHDVRTTYDGPSALQIAAEYRPHVTFLDIGLPGMDGYAVARQMHAMPTLDGMVLVAITGYGSAGDRRRSEETGFYAHMVKPVEFAAVQELLAAVTPPNR
ncbi:MAG TPA: PAS domain-containing protein [Gemmataceae bacterium]|nr:PAS domain-containing protein [Gemmataceae bacterium]